MVLWVAHLFVHAVGDRGAVNHNAFSGVLNLVWPASMHAVKLQEIGRRFLYSGMLVDMDHLDFGTV